MKKPLARKIIEEHLVSGTWQVGTEIGIRIDQTLTQDATGTLAYLEFESMDVGCIKTELSVATLTTISYRPIIKMPMTTAFSSPLPSVLASIFHHPAMAFHTRSIWNALAHQAKRYWVLTAIHLWVAHWA